MKKCTIEKLDLEVFSEQLENGLEIYVVPQNNRNNIYATFSTKYGSIHNEFIPIKDNKMKKVPDGVAHFLEHKVFEQPDGEDPFTFYSERGADANAFTTTNKTTYLFKGPDFFKENLEFLLDYVQQPYFTNENVEKEKGIIEQEIKMYQDDPYTRLYEGILYNSFIEHPIKYPIIGSVDSIHSITKEDLYTCYHTFYHPSNMLVVVTGNVKPKEVIDIIKQNQSNKKFEKSPQVKIKEYKEPDKVSKLIETIHLNVTIPKISVNYKINIEGIKDIPKRKIPLYLSILMNSKFGMTSTFLEKIKKDEIVHVPLDIDYVMTDTHILWMIMGETKEKEKLIELIKKEMQSLKVDEKEFERKKKIMLSSQIYMSEDIESINSKIMNNIIQYKEILYHDYETIENLNLEEMKKLIDQLKFTNFSIYIVDAK